MSDKKEVILEVIGRVVSVIIILLIIFFIQSKF